MNAVTTCLLVGLGSALGAVLRYLAGLCVTGSAWPWDTLLVNTSGCLAIGMISALTASAAAENRLLAWRLFLMPGLLGGYTTFSVFSLETLGLIAGNHFVAALGNIVTTVTGALLAVWAGRALLRHLLAPREGA